MKSQEQPNKQSSSGKWLMIVGVIVLFGVLVFGIAASPGQQDQAPDYQAACQEAGGTYISEHSECEYVDQGFCTALGGEYDECGSACRHEPDLVACTLNCVPFCTF